MKTENEIAKEKMMKDLDIILYLRRMRIRWFIWATISAVVYTLALTYIILK